MPLSANPFTGDAFSTVALTSAINLLPNKYGRLQELNLLPARPVRGRTIVLERRNGVLTLLPTMPVGSQGTVGKSGKRGILPFVIPHIPHEDVILPDEVQGIRAFGTENGLAALADVMAMKLADTSNKHFITLEHLRWGAIKGIILDADGSVLVDLYDSFGIVQKTINFALNVTTTDVRAKCVELVDYIQENLLGEVMDGITCMVSTEFFDALTNHAKVIKAWELWNQGEFLRSGQKGFAFGGVTFEKFLGKATDPSGAVRRFIAAGDGHAFPTGTTQSFATYFAPADFNETVNTLGQPLYAKQEPRKFDRGTDLHTQSNPLPMCHRPEILVKVTAQ